jgi:hypothetical protein
LLYSTPLLGQAALTEGTLAVTGDAAALAWLAEDTTALVNGSPVRIEQRDDTTITFLSDTATGLLRQGLNELRRGAKRVHLWLEKLKGSGVFHDYH